MRPGATRRSSLDDGLASRKMPSGPSDRNRDSPRVDLPCVGTGGADEWLFRRNRGAGCRWSSVSCSVR
jgi:hypothetical protein